MKVSVIGAGNVGSLSAMRIAQEAMAEVALVDIVPGLAEAKALDMDDARQALKRVYQIQGTQDIEMIRGSDIVVVTAGLTRRPGMTREELLEKNARILKDICLNIKRIIPQALLVIVTNPLDLMTRYALEITGFPPSRIFGMGVTLDASRFANLISRELSCPVTDIEACVIGTHGEGMLPLARLTSIRGIVLDEFIPEDRIIQLVKRTLNRGQEIVSLFGNGSAYFAPSACVAEIVRSVIKDEKRTLGVSAYLNGEYGLKDVCIGVPCRLGRAGIEKIVELDLDREEKAAFIQSAAKLKEQYAKIAS